MKIIELCKIKVGDIISIIDSNKACTDDFRFIAKLLNTENPWEFSEECLARTRRTSRFEPVIPILNVIIDYAFVLSIICRNDANHSNIDWGVTGASYGMKILTPDGMICWVGLFTRDELIVLHNE